MRRVLVPFVAVLLASACSVTTAKQVLPSDPTVFSALTSSDIALNRPATSTPEARFVLAADGTGTADIITGPHDARPISWALRGDQFCITQADGVLSTFGCATVAVDAPNVQFTDPTGKTATGTLIAR